MKKLGARYFFVAAATTAALVGSLAAAGCTGDVSGPGPGVRFSESVRLPGSDYSIVVPAGWCAVVRPDRVVLHDGPVSEADRVVQESLALFGT